MKKQKPTLIIFAGANGAGKTTAAEFILPRDRIIEFVNADYIAKGLSPLNPAGQAVKAGRLALERIRDLIRSKESFAIETTLSGRSLAALLKSARKQGYEIVLNYIYTSDVRINLKRIKYRVLQGGHDVPAADVRRRYIRSLWNLFHVYMALCDRIRIYDGSASADPVLIVTWIKGLGAAIASAHVETWIAMKKAGEFDDE